mmetsp:Transcript_20793/g.48939  ORF Transcript_20793/g.48939 Transcript_20793/m.48939 type:complete len:325 (-) Transcript_20793:962-1936(-)
MTHGGQPTAGRFSCGAAHEAVFSSHVFMTQYHSALEVRSMTFCLASMILRMALHFPQDGLQQRIHSWGSLELEATARFLPLVSVGSRDSYCSLHCNRRTHTLRCLRVRASAADSGVWAASYSSSGAEQRARSGSFLFMVQYHFGGSLRSSTIPRSLLHFLHLSHSTQVNWEEPVVCPKMLPSSRSASIPLSTTPMQRGLLPSANPLLDLSSMRKPPLLLLLLAADEDLRLEYWLRPFFLERDDFFLLLVPPLLVVPSALRIPSSSSASSSSLALVALLLSLLDPESPLVERVTTDPVPLPSPNQLHFLAICKRCARSRRTDSSL